MALNIAVVGPGEDSSPALDDAAEEVGWLIAQSGHTLITGGQDGVMQAACRGAAIADGMVVALLPGLSRGDANPYVNLAIPTGLGELRNGLIVRASDALICVGGSWGTLSEVALAMRVGVPVVMLMGWDLPEGPQVVTTAREAVVRAVEAASGGA